MKRTMTWLLAGAAFAVCAGASVALAGDPATAAQEAREDAKAAEANAILARAEADKARANARRARAEADRVRTERRDVRVYRDGTETRIQRGDGDVIVIHGGGREETLSRILQLRPEQQTALKTFLEATRNTRDDNGRDHMVRFDRETDSRTTLQRLDEMQARAAAQRAEMDRKVAAIKSFYAQLDVPQKKAFDAMPMLMMVGPTVGPMMIPRPLPIVHRVPPVPPTPPVPPVPPRS